jgi:thymidylate kinase
MLNIAQSLFEEFEVQQLKYCIFKEIQDLEKDLDGENGDVDLLISKNDFTTAEQILNRCGFKKVLPTYFTKGIYFFIGHDTLRDRHLLLHIFTELRLGRKRSKELRWAVEEYLIGRSEIQETGVRVIHPTDELYLLAIRILLKDNPKSEDLERLAVLRNLVSTDKLDPDTDLIKNQFQKMVGITAEEFFRSGCGDIRERLRMRSSIRRFLNDTAMKKIVAAGRILAGNCSHILIKGKLVLGFPSYRVRKKGKLVVLQGVDGSGKSTQYDMLRKSSYLRRTGVEFLYGGNNQYTMPGVNALIAAYKANPKKRWFLKNIMGLLTAIDRRLRMIRAIKAVARGKIVVFDRYFYDDVVSYHWQKRNKTRPGFEMFVLYLLHGWVGYRPDVTFFLDIDAEDAYKRKQDYAIERVEQMIGLYRDFFRNREEVIRINALDLPESINNKILKKIVSL